MDDFIGKIRERIQLKEGTAAIEKVLGILYFKQPVSTKELSQGSLLPIPVVAAMKKECIKLGIVEQRNGVALTESGIRYMEERFGYGGLAEGLYFKLMTDDGVAEDFACELAEEIHHVYEGRPQVDVTMDQAKGTALTAVKRAMLSLSRQTLLGKNILCVGDDDLVSVAVGFLLQKLYSDFGKNRTKIRVFEKDKRYIEYIGEIAGRYGLPIECVEVDLREPLSLEYTGVFDVFYTDPPYTLEGLSLFLSRGIGGLKKEKGLKIFLSFGQKPNEEIYRMQQALLSHGLIITAIYDAFNRYEGASLLGGISQLLVLETTDHTKAVVPVTVYNGDEIYTADKREIGTVYRCRNCGARIATGKMRRGQYKGEGLPNGEELPMDGGISMGGEPLMGGYNTIEKLKEVGCPECKGKIFDQVKKLG